MEAIVNASELLASVKVADVKATYSVYGDVCIDNNGDEYAIAATDSYRIVKFTNANDNDMRDESKRGRVLISANDIKANVKTTDGKVRIKTSDDDEFNATMEITAKKNETRTVVVNRIERNYPNLDRFLDAHYSDTDGTAVLNPSFMKDVCDAAMKAYGKKANVKIELRKRLEPVTVTSTDGKGGWMKAVIMPMRS